jgi:hypothetical protein
MESEPLKKKDLFEKAKSMNNIWNNSSGYGRDTELCRNILHIGAFFFNLYLK